MHRYGCGALAHAIPVTSLAPVEFNNLMITGFVTDDRESTIRLRVRGPSGKERNFETIVDTGYDASLTLPSHIIKELKLPWRRYGSAILGDGTECFFDVYEAVVVWDGRRRRVPVDAADTSPLVGMALLYGYELKIQVVET